MFRSSRVISFPWQNSMTDVLVPLRPPCWCPCIWEPTWRLLTKLYKFGWNTFPNNAWKNYRTDLNLGEVVYISIFFHIPVSWLDLLNGYVFFIFDGVTLQTSHMESWQSVKGEGSSLGAANGTNFFSFLFSLRRVFSFFFPQEANKCFPFIIIYYFARYSCTACIMLLKPMLARSPRSFRN